MRWKPKPAEEYVGPKIGDVRTVERFALFPTRMRDGTLVWLERYVERQTWLDSFLYGVGWSTDLCNTRETIGAKHEP